MNNIKKIVSVLFSAILLFSATTTSSIAIDKILFDKYKDWNRVAGAWRGGKTGASTAYPDDKAFKKRFNNAWLKESE